MSVFAEPLAQARKGYGYLDYGSLGREEFDAALDLIEQQIAEMLENPVSWREQTFRLRMEAAEQRATDMETLIARQLTPLDVAVTHIEVIRRKGDDYTAEERDNVAAIVEAHVREARQSLFAALSAREEAQT